MARGELVPDELTIAMVMERLARPDAAAGAILDGFPRTVGQAEALDVTLAEQRGADRAGRLHRGAHRGARPARVSGRWVCPTCGTPYHVDTDPPQVAGICDRDGTPLVQRDDDRPEVVRARMEKQIPPMEAVVDHYDAAGVVTRIDGRLAIPEVSRRIREALDAGAAASA